MEKIFVWDNHYGATVVKNWLEEEGLDVKVRHVLDSNNSSETRTKGTYIVLCRSSQVSRANEILGKVDLATLDQVPGQLEIAEHYLPLLEDEDLLITIFEEHETSPMKVARAISQLEKRGRHLQPWEIEKLRSQWFDERDGVPLSMPMIVGLYLVCLFLPPFGVVWGFRIFMHSRLDMFGENRPYHTYFSRGIAGVAMAVGLFVSLLLLLAWADL